jgi:heme exporter protein D
MSWNSFADFVHMGGYGLYVWGAYGVTLAVLVGESLLARRRRRQALRAVRETGAEVAA